MRHWIGIALAGCLAGACVPSQDKDDRLLADGLWGWQAGRGCFALADAVAIDGTRLTWFRDGAPVATGQALRRELIPAAPTSPNQPGRVAGLSWSYDHAVPSHAPIARHDVFTARFEAGTHRLAYLALEQRMEGGSSVSGALRLHDRLSPCPASAQPPDVALGLSG